MRCNDQLFSYAQSGQLLFDELAEQLQLLNERPQHYQLSRINLSVMPPQQSCVYMRYKQHIEEILNTSVLTH